MAISSRNTLLAALAFIAFQAQAVNVTVAYQTSAEPAKVAQADNTFAKESGATVDWRKFDSGASIVRALASGDVQIGNLGSSPLAVAASQQVPIEVFLLPLNFARRFVAGESSRSIKSDPQFIAMREYVLSRVFEQREAFS